MKCYGIRAETTFRLSAKRTSPFKLVGVEGEGGVGGGGSVQLTADRRGVRIGGQRFY